VKVKELIGILSKIDPEKQVILQKDAEGNDHSPLSGTWEGAYLAKTTWYGCAGLEKLSPEDKKAGYSEDDIVRGFPALILVPVN